MESVTRTLTNGILYYDSTLTRFSASNIHIRPNSRYPFLPSPQRHDGTYANPGPILASVVHLRASQGSYGHKVIRLPRGEAHMETERLTPHRVKS